MSVNEVFKIPQSAIKFLHFIKEVTKDLYSFTPHPLDWQFNQCDVFNDILIASIVNKINAHGDDRR
ncbi:hypothetical protein BH23THE1_BH23THE1_08940 [soil metagenome]